MLQSNHQEQVKLQSTDRILHILQIHNQENKLVFCVLPYFFFIDRSVVGYCCQMFSMMSVQTYYENPTKISLAGMLKKIYGSGVKSLQFSCTFPCFLLRESTESTHLAHLTVKSTLYWNDDVSVINARTAIIANVKLEFETKLNNQRQVSL